VTGGEVSQRPAGSAAGAVRRCQLAVIRAGCDSRDVRGWAWPRLILWAELAHEAEVESALLQAAAVWDAGKVADRLDAHRRQRRPAVEPEWEPMAERIERLKAEING